MEATLIARHADVLVTMDDARREIEDGALFVRGNRIEAVGATADLPASADVVIDLAGVSFTATYTVVPVAGPTLPVASATSVGTTSSGSDIAITGAVMPSTVADF